MNKTFISGIVAASMALAPLPSFGQEHSLEKLCRNQGPIASKGNIVGQKYFDNKCLAYAIYKDILIFRLFVPSLESANQGVLLFRTTDESIAKEYVKYSMKGNKIHYEPVGKPTQNLTLEEIELMNQAASEIESELGLDKNANKIPKQSI
tara:strand:+ start:374 stop:823 length:450 start_codon:yes stop_codon:yes gene_type:complete